MSNEPTDRPLTPTRVVAERVRELRKRHGWTAEQLGEEMTRTGIKWDRYAVANLERGRRQSLTVDELAALASAFGVSNPWDLVGDTCETCSNAPPAGFRCVTCDRAGPDTPTR